MKAKPSQDAGSAGSSVGGCETCATCDELCRAYSCLSLPTEKRFRSGCVRALEFLSCLDFSMLCHFCYVGPRCVNPDAMTLFADI